MKRLLELREKSKKELRKVVLPEGEDRRVVRGAAFLANERIAQVVLLGRKDEVIKLASEEGVDVSRVELIDPTVDAKRREVIEAYYQLRKHKGITPEDAEKSLMENFVFFGATMVRMGLADGYVAGASHTTADVARSALYCLQLDREIGTLTSCFIMELEGCSYGENGLFVYADCGIIPYPSAKQLVGITIAASDLFRKLFDMEPRVGMLSYSTKGSAKGPSIDSVVEAFNKVRDKRPDLMVDGELQLDAAVVPEVAAIKSPGSAVAGRANVLIFPNLDAGNISYKLTQRLAKSRAVGPIILGMDRPCSDLSRGCSWEDVVDTAVVTAVRAQGL
ncbi:MAG: phosphate acetyltransferase [Candidatus Omnitrophica bacterium]|nr:phosphate acetyltransferase [Candidatus Omnitrophota bacterium]